MPKCELQFKPDGEMTKERKIVVEVDCWFDCVKFVRQIEYIKQPYHKRYVNEYRHYEDVTEASRKRLCEVINKLVIRQQAAISLYQIGRGYGFEVEVG